MYYNMELHNSEPQEIIFDLELTKDINDINLIPLVNLKSWFEYYNSDILLKILEDKYELLTYKYINNYSSTTKIRKTKYESNISIIDNKLAINEYALYPIEKNYDYTVLAHLKYYYYTIKENLPKEGKLTIIKPMGPWEVKDNNFIYHTGLEDFLINNLNYDIKSITVIYLYFNYAQENNDIVEQKLDNYKKNNYIINDSSILNKNIIYKMINMNKPDNIKNLNKLIDISDNIIIQQMIYNASNVCFADLINLSLQLYLFTKCIEKLNNNGNLYIYLSTYLLSNSTLQLFYIIFNNFLKVELLVNNINPINFGFLKFSNFTRNDKIINELNKIINQYLKTDEYIGQYTVINFIPEKQDYCYILKKKETNIIKRYYLIRRIIRNRIKSSFLNFFMEIYEWKNKDLNKRLKNMESININNIHSLLSNNIFDCIEFCKKYNIEINELYNDFKPLNYKKIISDYFYNKPNINYNNLYINIDSIYSITKPDETVKIIDLIIKNFPNIQYIIDGTSNVGTTVIVLAHFFKYVYAVEILENTYNYLKNNVKEYKLNNVKCILDDVTLFMSDNKKLKSIDYNIEKYLLFLDPPWTGVFYKNEDNIKLYLSDINVLEFIKNIRVKYIVLKVPFNYNMKQLYKYFNNIIIYKLSGFFIIFIVK